jgi:hypothetical protein
MEAKVLAVAQATVGAYLAIVNALATFDGVPDPTGLQKIAKAAIIGAAAFAAVARVKAAAGFEKGGYTPRAGSNSKPVGVVHANEWVAPADMVEDPRYSSVIAALERARRGMGFGFGQGEYAMGGLVRGTALVNRSIDFVPRPSPSELQSAGMAGDARGREMVIFTRVTDINAAQGAVTRITDRSTL